MFMLEGPGEEKNCAYRATFLKTDMKSYIQLETAAIYFSSEPFSETGY